MIPVGRGRSLVLAFSVRWRFQFVSGSSAITSLNKLNVWISQQLHGKVVILLLFVVICCSRYVSIKWKSKLTICPWGGAGTVFWRQSRWPWHVAMASIPVPSIPSIPYGFTRALGNKGFVTISSYYLVLTCSPPRQRFLALLSIITWYFEVFRWCTWTCILHLSFIYSSTSNSNCPKDPSGTARHLLQLKPKILQLRDFLRQL